MDRKALYLLVVGSFVSQVFSANLGLNPALKQYLLASLGSQQPMPTRQSLPAVTISKSTPPNFQSIAALASLLAGASNHAPVPAPKPQPPSSILSALTEPPSNYGVDANLLNNLAMALQLLVVSNLLSSPQETPEPSVVPSYYEPEPAQPVSVYSYQQYQQHQPAPVPQNPAPNQYYHYEQPQQSPQSYYAPPQPVSMPSANFVGASTFADPFMGSVPPASGASSSRSGFTLMSPYEALSPSSPFSDPILSSPYGSIMTSKKDFQSPYTAIMAADNKDLFSMSDFF